MKKGIKGMVMKGMIGKGAMKAKEETADANQEEEKKEEK